VLTPLGDQKVVEKSDVSFECVFSKPDKPATWSKHDKPLTPSDRIEVINVFSRFFISV